MSTVVQQSQNEEVDLEKSEQGSDWNESNQAEHENGQENAKEVATQASSPKRSAAKIAIIMLALGLGVFLAALDISIVTTAIPTIVEDLGSASGYTWIGSAYLLGAAAATPLWGKFSDIFGRKPILLLANLVFFVGSLIAALANSMGMLIVGRSIQGVGGGGLITLVNICIGDLFSQRERGAYYGVIGGVWALASSLGPILGGAFTSQVTWRWCFWINLPFDGVAFAIILIYLDVKTPKTPLIAGFKAIDWTGALLIVGGTLMFLMGLQFAGETFPWSSATVICLLVFGVLTIILFGLVEWKFAKYPIIPLRLFSQLSNIGAYGVCFAQSFVFVSATYYLPLYFQAVLGATPLLSGVYLLPTALAISLSSVATGMFIKIVGKYIPPLLFGVVFMTLGFGLFIDLDASHNWAKIIIFQIIAGIGVGPNFQAPLICVQTGVLPRDIGTATATFGLIRNLASGSSVVIGGVIYTNIVSMKQSSLVQQLGPKLGTMIAESGVGASAQVVQGLPPSDREIAQGAFADSLRLMWILYVAVSAIGIAFGLCCTQRVLQKSHEETKTGLEAEEENRQAALREREAQRKS